MRVDFFVARRLWKGEQKSFSTPIIRIAIVSIALGLAVILASLAILQGFQSEIKNKIVGFGADVRVVPFGGIMNPEESSFEIEDAGQLQYILAIPQVRHAQVFALKPGIIKEKKEFQGVLMKGVKDDFDTDFLNKHLIEGHFLSFGNPENDDETVISKYIAERLQLQIGDKLRTYFYTDGHYRARAFKIVGIYDTGLNLYDEQLIFCHLIQIQKLNQWNEKQVNGVEIFLSDDGNLSQVVMDLYAATDTDQTIETIQELQPSLFAWLDFLDTNVVVILVIMALVSMITIIATLLIIIFEKTAMIGILKSIGAHNTFIVRVFLYKAGFVIMQGLLLGNILTAIFYFGQAKYKIFKLDPTTYYLDVVPVKLFLWQVLSVNVGILLICLLALLLPARIIGAITPIKAMKFE